MLRDKLDCAIESDGGRTLWIALNFIGIGELCNSMKTPWKEQNSGGRIRLNTTST